MVPTDRHVVEEQGSGVGPTVSVDNGTRSAKRGRFADGAGAARLAGTGGCAMPLIMSRKTSRANPDRRQGHRRGVAAATARRQLLASARRRSRRSAANSSKREGCMEPPSFGVRIGARAGFVALSGGRPRSGRDGKSLRRTGQYVYGVVVVVVVLVGRVGEAFVMMPPRRRARRRRSCGSPGRWRRPSWRRPRRSGRAGAHRA